MIGLEGVGISGTRQFDCKAECFLFNAQQCSAMNIIILEFRYWISDLLYSNSYKLKIACSSKLPTTYACMDRNVQS